MSNPPHHQPNGVVADGQLAQAFTKRLAQLGLSRREFARQSGLSRQTVHNIENEQRTHLAPATLAALDETLRWPPGKAYALATADSGFDETYGLTDEERANGLRWVIVRRLQFLTLEELETLAYQWADNREETNDGQPVPTRHWRVTRGNQTSK